MAEKTRDAIARLNRENDRLYKERNNALDAQIAVTKSLGEAAHVLWPDWEIGDPVSETVAQGIIKLKAELAQAQAVIESLRGELQKIAAMRNQIEMPEPNQEQNTNTFLIRRATSVAAEAAKNDGKENTDA